MVAAMSSSRICALAVSLLGWASAAAAPKPIPAASVAPPSATGAFDRLRGLVGDWDASLPGGKSYHVSFRLISSDSALVETYTSASGRETLTIYTVDGDRLLATHYCAQGNQPRLALTAAAGALAFDFVDATNLRDPASSHLHHLELTPGPYELTETEVYRTAGKDAPEQFVFKRRHAPPPRTSR